MSPERLDVDVAPWPADDPHQGFDGWVGPVFPEARVAEAHAAGVTAGKAEDRDAYRAAMRRLPAAGRVAFARGWDAGRTGGG